MSTDINTKLGIFSTYSAVQSSVCLYSGDIEKDRNFSKLPIVASISQEAT